MTNWIELIEEKQEEITSLAKEAYKDAMENTHLRFIVEMDEDGEIYTWQDIAGGNSFHVSTREGTSIEILEFCFQYNDIEIIEENIISKLEENKLSFLLEELQEEAEEEGSSLEVVMINSSNSLLNDIIRKCQDEEIQWQVDEYAWEESDRKINELIYHLKSQ